MAVQEDGKMLCNAERPYPCHARGNDASEQAEAGAGIGLSACFVFCCISQNLNAVNR